MTWGGVGTDAQHAVFQLLHQGTHLVPVEFVAVSERGRQRSIREHHRQLLLNCFAQGAALMAGRRATIRSAPIPATGRRRRSCSTGSIRATLGALIAFYEHRTFANAVLLGINPFDQFGVELGKEIARRLDRGREDARASIRRPGADREGAGASDGATSTCS